MIKVIKLRTILIVAIVIIFALIFSFSFLQTTGSSQIPQSSYMVVIDAGHGGIDGGSVGKTTGVYESELNLVYAFNLQKQLNEMGISSFLTRKDKNGLYESNAKNLKKSDMLKRKSIIEACSPNVVVSLHMDSFPLSSCVGAQAYYKKNNESGKRLADCVQKQISSNIANSKAKKHGKVGDYYIVNCTDIPSVLVECGFLSNKDEEQLLQTKEYQAKICYSIMCGIIDFFNIN